MPVGQLDVLNRTTLTATVQNFKYPQLQLSAYYGAMRPERTKMGDTAEWDILKPTRSMAKPKAPGAPAKLVALEPMGHRIARCIHVAEKLPLDGDRLANLRQPGTDSDPLNDQLYVAQQQLTLDRRRAMLREFAIAQMFTGALAVNEDDIKVAVDYAVDSTHKPTAAASWATASTDIHADLKTWKLLAEQDSGYTITDIWARSAVNGYLLNNTQVGKYLRSSEATNQVTREGFVSRLFGFNWHWYDAGYMVNGTFTPFIAENQLIMTPEPDPSWMGVIEGSTKINPNPGDQKLVDAWGPYAYIRLKDDPAAYVLYQGDTFLPVLKIPDAIVYAKVVA
ncbi:MAG TPA: major capsid protein [Candidatus Brocadiia bacterium]|nr:major capsid protein [Candidatus Brocadiia bacterium]